MSAAFITGATAIATGLLGYLGALLQHRAERDRIGVERARLESEGAARRSQRVEEQRERRRAIYLAFLEVAEHAWTLANGPAELAEPDLDEWWRRFQGVRRALVIGAASDVVDAAQEMNAVLLDVFYGLREAVREGAPEARRDGRNRLWNERGQAFDGALGTLQGNMRADLEVTE